LVSSASQSWFGLSSRKILTLEKYQKPPFLFNGHLETIYPAVFRKIMVSYRRERIDTPDNDFLDLDWLTNSSEKLVIISHGLEGNSNRAYVTGMARIFYEAGYSVIAWNFRGCSNEMNRQLRFYHSGATDDLMTVINHATKKGFREISLVGFSLGGNLTLKYLGEQGTALTAAIKSAVTFSVPLHLHSSCLRISSPANWVYAQRFLSSLKKKILIKAKMRNDLDVSALSEINTLIEFDNRYTAPLHGFANAICYYDACSSLNFLNSIAVPTLIVNAQNDPFLTHQSFPETPFKSSFVRFEKTAHGGHCGFSLFNQKGRYWSEIMALSFVNAHD
jgi:hypothetical protein